MNQGQVVDAVITLSTICRGKLSFTRGTGKSLSETILEQMGKIEGHLTEEERRSFNSALSTLAEYAYSCGDGKWGDVMFSHLLRLVRNLDETRTSRIRAVTATLVRQAQLTASRVVARSCRREIAFADFGEDDSSEWTERRLPDTTGVDLDVFGIIKINVEQASISLNKFAKRLWDVFQDPDIAEIIAGQYARGMPTEFEVVPPVVIRDRERRWKTRRFDMTILVLPVQRNAAGLLHFIFVPDYNYHEEGVRGVILTNQSPPPNLSVIVHKGWVGGGSVMVVDRKSLVALNRAAAETCRGKEYKH